MNILFLIDSLEGGGAQRACLNIAGRLSRKHQVCIAPIFSEPDPGYLGTGSLRIVPLRFDSSRTLWKKPLRYALQISELKRLKRSLKTDCCISFLETANFLNAVSQTGEAVIISVRNYYSESIYEDRPIFHRIKARIAGRHADRVVGVSKAICRDLSDVFGVPEKKLVPIYNFIDILPISGNRNDAVYQEFLRLKNGVGPVFVSSGRFVWQKGYAHLIRAFREVVKVFPKARLFLFGQGDLEEKLRSTAARNQLENHVFFPGFDPGIADAFRASDVYVCSSMHEGFSNSMLEAMACGLPVISADCRSGPRELLAPDTDNRVQTENLEFAEYGILVPVCSGKGGDPERPLEPEEQILAQAMLKMAGDSEMRKKYAAKSEERIRFFEPEHIMPQWERIILETVEEKENGKVF